MRMTHRIDGFAELDRALGELPKRTAKSTLVSVGKKALAPVAETANSLAPDDPGTPGGLHVSFSVSTRLNKRQASLRRRAIRAGQQEKYFAEVYAGTNDPAGIQQEFGNVNHGPQPMLRPAWDQHRHGVLETIRRELWGVIQKAAQRVAARQAKASGE